MRLELLAPAKDVNVARQAILHGADAVYIGGPSHGARAAASNSLEDIKSVVDFAHRYGVRVYITLNTIVYDNEIKGVERTIWDLWRVGADALIVQDMGILRMSLPPIALHASTQCDIRTPEKALFLAKCGFSQLVLPRELSLSEVEAVRSIVPRDVQLEAFVHGALCVSYSGDCQASCVANGRSANRGECAQMCRMAYDLVDGDGNVLAKNKHLLSLRDMCHIDDIEDMAAAGVSSFKIEGRLKDAGYVKNAVWAYRQAIDRLISKYPDKYSRSSWGEVRASFDADLEKSFNRGFTKYFLNGVSRKPMGMAGFDTPKWIGEKVGSVIKSNGKVVIANLSATLNNGDGLGYFNPEGRFEGFRLNKIDGNKLFPATKLNIATGADLYRNRDVKRDAALDGDTARREVYVDVELRRVGDYLCLKIEAENDVYAESTVEIAPQAAKSDQKEPRKRVLAKLGDTIYALRNLRDHISADEFVPASVLTSLRRKAVSLLDASISATYAYDMRREEESDAVMPEGTKIDYHYNVANAKAVEFYESHGLKVEEKALEVRKGENRQGKVVMTTRYCLRREMGACLREKECEKLPARLYLKNRAVCYELQFDCKNCQMHVVNR